MQRVCLFLGFLLLAGALRAAEAPDLAQPGNRVKPEDPAWKELTAGFAAHAQGAAAFEERRHYPFAATPIILEGKARVSDRHGLSLEYTKPDPRILILDAKGMLLREAGRDKAAPDDPRASAANQAMLHVMRFDLAALGAVFDIFGRHDGKAWELALLPKSAELRQAFARMNVTGEGPAVRRIELRRSARNSIEILMPVSPDPAPFSAEEVRRFFR